MNTLNCFLLHILQLAIYNFGHYKMIRLNHQLPQIHNPVQSVHYIEILLPFLPIMLVLCSMLLPLYYAKIYVGIIGYSLPIISKVNLLCQNLLLRILFFQQFLCYKLGKDFEPFNNQSQLDGQLEAKLENILSQKITNIEAKLQDYHKTVLGVCDTADPLQFCNN